MATKQKRPRVLHSPELIKEAVKAARDKRLSIRAAAAQYGIPYATLKDKVNGKSPIVKKETTLLTKEEESELVDWLKMMSQRGFGSTAQDVCQMAKGILNLRSSSSKSSTGTPTSGWFNGFVERHKDLGLCKPIPLEKEQALITPQAMKMGDNIPESIFSAIEKENANLRNLSMDIWNNPELRFKEQHAHKVLTRYLSEHGFQVTQHYILDTAFKATFSKEGDGQAIHIGVCCEYDALPGIGHACGHNLIAIQGVAVGLGIKEAMESCGVKGELTVLGTPAEEGGGGKIDLIDAGAFSSFDIALMAHPSRFNLPKPIYIARGGFNVEYEGKASHAASAPWSGINALDAAVICYQNVSCMRQHLRPTWRAHGIITNGGEAPNVIPEAASLQYYVRAPTMEELEELNEKMIGCFEGAARATGCKVKHTELPKPYHPLNSNPTLASLYQKHGESLGIEFEKDPMLLTKQGGSTDMGNVSRVLPSIHPKFSLKTKAAGHTKEFRDVAGTEASHAITLQHAKALALAAVDVLQSPSLLQTIKDEFKKSMNLL